MLRALQAAAFAAALVTIVSAPDVADINPAAGQSSAGTPTGAPSGTGKLTLENAQPLPIPPRPDVGARKAPPAPARCARWWAGANIPRGAA